MAAFRFLIFGDAAHYAPTETLQKQYATTRVAKNAARRLAERHDCPVDLAADNDRPWNAAYIGTARPSLVRGTGASFGRED